MALANSGPNTNDSQFFITDAPTTWLNQVHIIFGQVINGWDIYDTIMGLPTDDGDRPLDPPLLASVDIINSPQDGTITFLADAGFSGDANITVTLDDGNGNQTDHVILFTDDLGDAPAATDDADIFLGMGESHTITFTDDEGRPVELSGSIGGAGFTVVSNDDTGQVTVTAPDDFSGLVDLNVVAVEAGFVGRAPGSPTFAVFTRFDYDPVGIGRISTDNATATFLDGTTLFVADRLSGLMAFDITNPAAPIFLDTFATNQAWDVVVVDNVAFVADAWTGLISIDVSDPTDMTFLTNTAAGGGALIDLALSDDGNTLFGAVFPNNQTGAPGAVDAYDISDPDAATIPRVGTITNLDTALAIAQVTEVEVDGNTLFATGLLNVDGSSAGGVASINVTNPAAMTYLGGALTGGNPWGSDLQDDLLYVADQNIGLQVYDVANPASIELVGELPLDGSPWRVGVSGKLAIVGAQGGFLLADVSDPDDIFGEGLFLGDVTGQGVTFDGDRIILSMAETGVALLDGDAVLNSVMVIGSRTVVDDGLVPVTFAVKGGVGRVYASDVLSGHIEKVELFDTGPTSSFTITTSGGNTTVDEVGVFGSLKKFTAKTTTLAGDFAMTGGLAGLVLRGVTGGGNLDIHTDSGIPVAAKVAVKMAFGVVNGVNIDTNDVPIKSLTSLSWANGTVSAPWIGKFASKGGISGTITATGQSAKGVSIGAIQGLAATGLTVNAFGAVGAVKLLSWAGGALTASAVKSVKTTGLLDAVVNVATAGAVKVGGNLAGSWTGTSIKSVAVKGDLTADILLTRAADVAGKVLALGKLKVTGLIRDNRIVTYGHVGSVMAGGMQNADLYVGYTQDPITLTGLPTTAQLGTEFDALATLKSLKIKGIKVGTTYVDSFLNSNVAAPRFLAAAIAYAETDNATGGGAQFGLTAQTLGKYAYKNAANSYKWSTKNLPTTPTNFDKLVVRLG